MCVDALKMSLFGDSQQVLGAALDPQDRLRVGISRFGTEVGGIRQRGVPVEVRHPRTTPIVRPL
jgi:hypothetical protein